MDDAREPELRNSYMLVLQHGVSTSLIFVYNTTIEVRY